MGNRQDKTKEFPAEKAPKHYQHHHQQQQKQEQQYKGVFSHTLYTWPMHKHKEHMW